MIASERNSDLAALLDGAQLLAQSDATYYHIAYVVRVDTDGALTPYCAPAEWPTSLAGQLAAKDQEIAALRAQIAALTAGHPEPPDDPPAAAHTCDQCGKAFDTAKKLHLHQKAAHAPDAPQACTICGKEFRKARALAMHQQRTGHQPPAVSDIRNEASPADDVPPRMVLTTAMPLDDDPTWRCAACGSDAFSRSMTDPTRCMRCVKATNGVTHAAA